ncbi:MAG: DUF362 domain-containing protein [Spirochaetota bacterium]
MTLHRWLDDPAAVLVSRTPVPTSPTGQDFARAARAALTAMELELDHERVVVKPNVTSGELFADPDSGITTHPQFVHGLLDYLLDHGATADQTSIVEDPRDTDDDEPRHWRGTGYLDVAGSTGVGLRSPTTASCVSRPVPDPFVFHELAVDRETTDPQTVLINAPKLKTHNLAITTLAMKNLMGIVYTPDRHYCRQAWLEIAEADRTVPSSPDAPFDTTLHERWQTGLARRLADTAKVAVPRLNVVEGVVGRDGTGFRNGRNYALGLVVAGTNVVAVDAVASYLMGFDPFSLIYLRIAAEADLGTHDLEAIRVFEVDGGRLVRCDEPARLRGEPFRVISRLPSNNTAWM